MTTSGVPVRAGLYDLDSGFEGMTASGMTIFHAPTTPEIAHDASASDVEELLEMLPSLGQVNRLVRVADKCLERIMYRILMMPIEN